MAEYKVRKLYKISVPLGEDIPETHESVWAYSVQYPGADHRTPGRFRIRITKMTASEWLSMMGHESADPPPDGFSIQGYCEKWTSNGWIHCLDWIGHPDTSIVQIEEELLEMYQAFTTGEPLDKTWDPIPDPPKPPREKKVITSPKLKVFEGDKKESDPPKKSKEDPSFDWI